MWGEWKEKKDSEKSVKYTWNPVKVSNIRVNMKQEENKKQDEEVALVQKIMAPNFPKLTKGIKSQIKEPHTWACHSKTTENQRLRKKYQGQAEKRPISSPTEE